MDELKLIGQTFGWALLCNLVWLVPLLIYRRIKGIPMIPTSSTEPIDIKSRRERNRLIISIAFSVGLAVYFFGSGFPIMGVLWLFAGVFLFVRFEVLDRNVDNIE